MNSSARSSRNTAGIIALGVNAFAGVLLAMVSIFQLLLGLAAVGQDDVYIRGIDYIYAIDLTAWGWIHLLLGALSLATGIAILAGQAWGLLVGIVMAAVQAIATFAFLPYHPLWSMVVIAFDALVLWSLCTRLADQGDRAVG